jgi:hypothetical protein
METRYTSVESIPMQRYSSVHLAFQELNEGNEIPFARNIPVSVQSFAGTSRTDKIKGLGAR